MTLLIIFFCLSIVFSFLCSIWEAVLLSINQTYINRQVRNDEPIGHQLVDYKKDIDRPLSAILTLNTIAHTIGAIGVGAQAGQVFGANNLSMGPIHLSYESIVAGLMTLAILILSEIIPKTIGANYWERLTPFTVKSIRVLLFILAPFVWLSVRITKALKNEGTDSVLSRADYSDITKEGRDSGVLKTAEFNIIDNLLKLNELKVRDIMTPRTVMIKADQSITVRAFHEAHRALRFSRIPIFQDQVDHITGMVLKDDILLNLAEDRDDVVLEEIKRPLQAIRENVALTKLFDQLIRNKDHMMIVVDEYGTLNGLVTMEDVLETILGFEIVDEFDKVEDLQKVARNIWNERAKNLGLIE